MLNPTRGYYQFFIFIFLNPLASLNGSMGRCAHSEADFRRKMDPQPGPLLTSTLEEEIVLSKGPGRGG